MAAKYWAHRTGKPKSLLGPFETRDEAIAAVFASDPKAKEATSGYGSEGPWFDIRWTKREGK